MYKNRSSTSELHSSFIDQSTGTVYENIYIAYLRNKDLESTLTAEEELDWKKLRNKEVIMMSAILKKELQKSHGKVKDLSIQYKTELRQLIRIAAGFREQRLLNSKTPIWWDFEGFLHVFMRHVRETKVGGRFVSKTVFPYQPKDILSLVKAVLQTISKEIDQHFEVNPKKNFFRKGTQALYYNGDYYGLYIAPNGRLETFYKDVRPLGNK